MQPNTGYMSHRHSATAPTPPRRGVVPYVASWSEEQDPSVAVVRRGAGIAYADETLADRDSHGVLWWRTTYNPGTGHPEFARVHPLRQRHAMRRLLCQVCASPADHTADGVLWLFRDHPDDEPGWQPHTAVTEPPVCLPCARLALHTCPALRKGVAAYRSHHHPIVGAYGAFYTGSPRPVMVKEAEFYFGDPSIRWLIATRLVRELIDPSPVPLAHITNELPQ